MRERNEAVLDRRKIRGLRLLQERVWRIEDLGGQRRPWFERIFGAGFSENVFKRADRPVLVVNDREPEGSALMR